MTDTLGPPVKAMDLAGEMAVQEAEQAAIQAAETASRKAVGKSLQDRATLRKSWMRRYAALLLCADTAAGLIAAAAAYASKPWVSHQILRVGYLGKQMSYPEMAVLSVLAWLAMLAGGGAYRSKHVAADERDYRVPVRAAVRLVAGIAVGSFALHMQVSRVLMMAFFASLVVSVVTLRGIVNLMLHRARVRGRARARMLLVGEVGPVRAFADHLLRGDESECDIVAVCTTGTDEGITVRDELMPVMGTPDDIIAAVHAVSADTVVVASPSGFTSTTLQQVAWQLERLQVDLLVAPNTVALAGPRLKVSSLRELPVLHVRHPRHESLLRSFHFALSRLAGALLLTLLSPLLLAVALAIKAGSPGPVFYRQKRIGYKGEEFDMLKFRSMVPDAEHLLANLLERNEHDGCLFKIKDDPRITAVGRFLRRYSLDELPQLINVVKGQMTLVGPRPCLAREMTMFGEAEHRRFMVRPGMTGLWQVSGRSDLPWADAVKTDLYYVDNWSPALDATILWRTLRVVLAGSGC